MVIAGRIAARPSREYAGSTMAAYAAIAYIGRADPQLTVRDLERDLNDGDRDGGSPTVLADTPSLEIRPSTPGPLTERLIRARELWTQTTFYLFDGNGWPV
jgi:hypothetical protein